jgi:hypothetical protein
MTPKRSPYCPGAGTPAVEGRFQLADVEDAAIVGFGQNAAKLARGELSRDVEERSGEGSHQEPAPINGIHLAGVVNANFRQ